MNLGITQTDKLDTIQKILLHYPIYVYLIIWIILVLIAAYFLLTRNSILKSKAYAKFILVGWKIVTFCISTFILSLISLIANDPTWDILESIIMCTLTFITAPWAVGVVYRSVVLSRNDWTEFYCAVCIWLFSSSWVYDLYVLLWRGEYPLSWASNLMISPILYLSAGMIWSLDYRKGKGAVLAFREKEWMVTSPGSFKKLFWHTLPFILLGVGIFGGFLYFNY